MRVPLSVQIQIRLNGAGAGTARVGPLSAREVWYPKTAAVKVNQNPTLNAQCNIYCGMTPTDDRFRDNTVNGSNGDSTAKVSGDTLKCNEYVWAVWTGGDANQIATLTVTGEKDV